ncbi:hypothetical protein EJB05_16995 [Eragrostis curvula]|uniref:Uncharacterized protein n=1 Tax=Eragrostis curvula TaxID=38414 RepID=A0A5J9VI97_9POAL|nr:hypothetical protein EJB05_16995 [Eragrostis curvula]
MVMEEAMDSEMSLSNMVLGFLEDAGRERWPEKDGDDDDGATGGDNAESKAFWQAQHSQLHEALAKTSPAESRIRADTEEAIKSMRAAAGAACSCTGRPAAGDGRRCMLRHVAERLRDAGYNSALCKSKWMRSTDIPSANTTYSVNSHGPGHPPVSTEPQTAARPATSPCYRKQPSKHVSFSHIDRQRSRRQLAASTSNLSTREGKDTTLARTVPKSAPDRYSTPNRWFRVTSEHSYVDVVVQTRSGKTVRVVVELSFRAEFEVARASAEYRTLVTALPELFVGRADRLRAVVKVVCAAAKQCMKENNMHMGPWRKHKYMQSKWLGTTERTAAAPAMATATATPVVPTSVVALGSPEKQTKFRASMLSFDFGRTAVEVV